MIVVGPVPTLCIHMILVRAMQPVSRRRFAHSQKSRVSTNVRSKPYLHLGDQQSERKAPISELKLEVVTCLIGITAEYESD